MSTMLGIKFTEITSMNSIRLEPGISFNEGKVNSTTPFISKNTRSFTSSVAEEVAKQFPAPGLSKVFLAHARSETDIAKEAVKNRLTRSELVASLSSANYGGLNMEQISSSVDNFMEKNKTEYKWNARGELVETPNTVHKTANSVSSTISTVQHLMERNRLAANDSERLATGLGHGVGLTVGEAKHFFSNTPDTEAILKKASELCMSDEELASMLVYGRGDIYDPLRIVEQVNASTKFGFDSAGRICALDGAAKTSQNGNSMLSIIKYS